MDINKKSWGTILVCKNSSQKDKRYDKQKSISINNSVYPYQHNEIYDLIYRVIELTSTLKYNEFLKFLEEMKIKFEEEKKKNE